MKNFTLLAIALIITTLQLSGQKSKSAIYLKNGSIIYGTLSEISDNQYKLKGKDGSLYIFPAGDVEKYQIDIPVFEGRKEKGFSFSLEGGLLIGSQSTEYKSPFSFNAIFGYTFDTKNNVGFGTGAEFIGETYTPMYLEFRRLINDKRVAPFLFVRTGLLVYLGGGNDDSGDSYPYYNYDRKDFKGGPSITAGTGISWSGEDIETYLSFAYRYCTTSYDQLEYNQQEVSYTNYYNRLEVKFGFRF
jgi:hypothetical protein